MPDTSSRPELQDWPELENAAQATGGAGTASALPHEIVRGAESAGQEPLLSYWDPVVTRLLERVAHLTAWHADPAAVYGYDELVPLGIATYASQRAIAWKVGSTRGLMWGNAGAAREEYFEFRRPFSHAQNPRPAERPRPEGRAGPRNQRRPGLYQPILGHWHRVCFQSGPGNHDQRVTCLKKPVGFARAAVILTRARLSVRNAVKGSQGLEARPGHTRQAGE